MKIRLGVFGGTFDPIHIGHLIAADAVVEALDLDRLLFVPAQRSPRKPDDPSASDADRVAMLDAATAGDDRLPSTTSTSTVRRRASRWTRCAR
ncbi:MAG: adenylyltransferase/cytidyltransferase family protein [Ardenticatenales bacterium]|nr:adenylyltransferase/cytidyltransferase family protein [Ardenticatenales bacterium]